MWQDLQLRVDPSLEARHLLVHQSNMDKEDTGPANRTEYGILLFETGDSVSSILTQDQTTVAARKEAGVGTTSIGELKITSSSPPE
uniref:Uncharacterized protein n=1 Tax=Ditylenchus dipsaci TaxID=166011 RepID=A0A915DSC6_9BILA